MQLPATCDISIYPNRELSSRVPSGWFWGDYLRFLSLSKILQNFPQNFVILLFFLFIRLGSSWFSLISQVFAMNYARFEEFLKGMALVHGSVDGTGFNPSSLLWAPNLWLWNLIQLLLRSQLLFRDLMGVIKAPSMQGLVSQRLLRCLLLRFQVILRGSILRIANMQTWWGASPSTSNGEPLKSSWCSLFPLGKAAQLLISSAFDFGR